MITTPQTRTSLVQAGIASLLLVSLPGCLSPSGVPAKVGDRVIEAIDDDDLATTTSLVEKHPEVVSYRSKKGWHTDSPPLNVAAFRGRVEIVQMLLKKGAAVDGRGRWSMTPLMKAADQGHLVIAKMLLDAGADVNATTSKMIYSGSALHCAIRRGHKEVVAHLLKAGADPNLPDPRSKRVPFDNAKDQEMRQLIRSHGGKTAAEL